MRSAWLALLVGCGFQPTAAGFDASDGPHDSPLIDTDTPIDAPRPLDDCYGAFEHICIAAPTQPLNITSQTIDTDTSLLCRLYTGNVDACVIAGTTVTIASGTTVVAAGSKPLIIISPGLITVDGTLD